MPVRIGLARLAAALTAWDTGSGSSPVMAGAGAVGGAATGSSSTQAAGSGTGRHQQDPPGGTLT
jgi:hypothetical protein